MKKILVSLLLASSLVSSEQYYQDTVDYTYLIGTWRQTVLIKEEKILGRDILFIEYKTFYLSDNIENECYLIKQETGKYKFLYITINFGKENDIIRTENAGGIYDFCDYGYDHDKHHSTIEAKIKYCKPKNKESLILFEVVNEDRNKDLYAGFSMKLSNFMIGASYGNNQALTGLIGLSTNRFSLFGQTTLAHSNSLNTDVLTHQLTLRFNSSTSRKARRYITL
jgi:hypothetical protein